MGKKGFLQYQFVIPKKIGSSSSKNYTRKNIKK